MKIYIVTQGCYSDYHIEGVYSTREKAQEVTGGLEDKHDISIEEHEVDAPNEKVFRLEWHSTIDLATGNIKRYGPWVAYCDPEGRGSVKTYTYRPQEVSARSFVGQEHADKLAIEYRQDWLMKSAESFDRATAYVSSLKQ